MIINHNCCIKLVRLVIFIYDARSHIHQIGNHLSIHFLLHGVFCLSPARSVKCNYVNTVEPGYNDSGISDISSITSDVLSF